MQENKELHFFWYYRSREDQGNELRYSMESIKKYYGDKAVLWLVGDQPNWYKAGDYGNSIPTGQRVSEKFSDIYFDISTIAHHPDTPDRYILMMDDIYAVNEFCEEDIKKPFYYEELTAYWIRMRRPNTSSHVMGVHNCATVISRDYPRTTYNYACHVPFHINKEAFLWMDQEYGKMLKDPNTLTCWEIIYGNIFYNDAYPEGPVLASSTVLALGHNKLNAAQIEQEIRTNKFLVNSISSHSEDLEEFLYHRLGLSDPDLAAYFAKHEVPRISL